MHFTFSKSFHPSNFTENIFASIFCFFVLLFSCEQNRTVLYLNDDWTETIALIFGDGYIYTKWFAT